MIFLNNFAERLKSLRKTKKINQNTLGKLLNLSQMQISKYEVGQSSPSLDVLLTLSKIFNVSLNYLTGLSTGTEEEKAWIQKYKNKRLHLFTNPDGTFEYKYFANGKEQSSIFKYTFGILPLDHVDFKPVFIVIDELEGNFLELMTGCKYLKDLSGKVVSYPNHLSFTNTNLPFIAFVNFLNEQLQLGYRLNKERNGLHRVNIIVKYYYGVPDNPYYLEIKSGSDMPVKFEEVFYGHFLNEQYLPLSTQEKIKNLSYNIDEAFNW